MSMRMTCRFGILHCRSRSVLTKTNGPRSCLQVRWRTSHS